MAADLDRRFPGPISKDDQCHIPASPHRNVNLHCSRCVVLTEELAKALTMVTELSASYALLVRNSPHEATVPDLCGVQSRSPRIERKSVAKFTSGQQHGSRETAVVAPPLALERVEVGHACSTCKKWTHSNYGTCRRCYRRSSSNNKTGNGSPAQLTINTCVIRPSRKRKLHEAVPVKVQQVPPKGDDEGKVLQQEALPVLIEQTEEVLKPAKIERESGYDTDSTHSVSTQSDISDRRSDVSTPVNLDDIPEFFPSNFLVPDLTTSEDVSKLLSRKTTKKKRSHKQQKEWCFGSLPNYDCTSVGSIPGTGGNFYCRKCWNKIPDK